MFNRNEYMKYVGDKSGSSYAAGLVQAESIYSISIDEEYRKDLCNSLIQKIESEKQDENLNNAGKKQRSNMVSHVRKYVEFMKNALSIEQCGKFIRWMREQPRRDDVNKRYSPETIDAAAAKLRAGLRSLGIEQYKDTNCFDILDPQEFGELYHTCYTAAEESDKKQNHRDFRNGLDFYLKFLNIQNGIDSIPDNIVKSNIRRIIALYKENLEQVNHNERFKWKAIGWYKKHWNIESEDFAEMLENAFKDAGGLLASNKYWTRKMLVEYAKAEPEAVRKLFHTLYDESLPLADRYTAFKEGFESYVKPINLRHYQDLHAISVYLTFEYPEKYYIYISKVYTTFCKWTGYVEEKPAEKTSVWKLDSYNRLCEIVLDEVRKDAELIAMSKARLDADCYQDEAFHILTSDIIFYSGSYMSGEQFRREDDSMFDLHTMGVELDMSESKTDVRLNTILYGPPGTGKTYHTVIYAVAIIENKKLADVEAEDYELVRERYNRYKEQGLIAFTTFHQSYGYEEFIEGIRPVLDDADNIYYDVQPGIFKSFCEKTNPKVKTFDDAWDELTDQAVSQGNKYTFTRRTNSLLQTELYDEDTFIVTWSGGTTNKLKKERVYEQWVANDYAEKSGLRGGKKWMLEALQAVIDTMISRFGLPPKEEFIEKKNYVFIIDEINRGNISKVFGELITLIEEGKRIGSREEVKVILPYSRKAFGVPDNVYIIGTMNTADRSIAAIDTALRRRFFFREMLPEIKVLEGIEVEGLSISNMLDKMNQRISVLYDREHTIGHAYFMRLKENSSMETLAEIFMKNIIPLLQEYFYEDYEKIRLVLGDTQKQDPSKEFILAKTNNFQVLFGNTDIGLDESVTYEINEKAFYDIEAYRFI